MSEKLVCVYIRHDILEEILKGNAMLVPEVPEDGKLVDITYIRQNYRKHDLIYCYFEVDETGFDERFHVNTFSYYKGEYVPVIIPKQIGEKEC